MLRTTLRFLLVGTLALGAWATCANAATMGTCTFGSSVGPADLSHSTACVGVISGNDTQANIDALDPFGTTNWILSDKSDGSLATVGPIDLLGFYQGSATSGTWSVSSFAGYTNVMITLSQGTAFAAYLLDTAFLSGDWSGTPLFDTINPGNGKQQAHNLSHFSIWYDPDSKDEVPPPVPLPPAALLFMSGLLGLRFLSKGRSPTQA